MEELEKSIAELQASVDELKQKPNPTAGAEDQANEEEQISVVMPLLHAPSVAIANMLGVRGLPCSYSHLPSMQQTSFSKLPPTL